MSTFLHRPAVATATALAAVYVIWGSTYLAIAEAVRSLPPLLMLSLRFLLAGGIVYAWSARRVGRPSLVQWRAAFVVGALLLFVDTGAVAWAEQRRLDTGTTALLCATVPFWLVGLDAAWEGRRLGGGTVTGIAVGLLGVALLVGPSASGLDLPAVAAVLGGAIAWAVGSLYARRADLPGHELAAGMQMLAAGLLLGLAAVVAGEARIANLSRVTPGSVGALAYLVVFGSLAAFTAYGWLLRRVPTRVLASHAYVNPVVAVALGRLVLGEPITATTVLAGLLVLVSVGLLLAQPERREPAPIPSDVWLPIPARHDFSRLAA
jgi:drug/metabolite transporter (DMT)-like permease